MSKQSQVKPSRTARPLIRPSGTFSPLSRGEGTRFPSPREAGRVAGRGWPVGPGEGQWASPCIVRALLWGAVAAGMLVLLSQPVIAGEEVSGPAKARDAVTLAIDGARYRLAGVDPFTDGKCGEATCAAAAEAALSRLVEAGPVTCLKLHKVGHGFFLARCRTSVGVDVAERLLEEGLADLGEGADKTYRSARDRAKAAGKGRWAS